MIHRVLPQLLGVPQLCVIVLLATVFGPAAADGRQPDSPVADFETLFRDWTELDRQLDAATEEYRTAPRDKRQAAREKYVALVSEADKLLPQLRAAGAKQFESAPNQDRRVTQALLGIVANDLNRDDFDAVASVSDLLLRLGKNNPENLSLMAGVAAYCRDDFETAERQLKAADENGSIDETASLYLQDVAQAKSLWAEELKIRQAEAQADDLPRVKLETNRGTLILELYENEAPETVGNFISLVEKKFYDGLTFHRVLPGFMAQGGCPDGTGAGDPGYKIYCECLKPEHRNHFRGTLSMAKGRPPHTGGSQFFITFRRTDHLDGEHTAFGRVIEGLELLPSIQRRDPNAPNPPAPDMIVRATVIRKRNHAYVPHKVK